MKKISIVAALAMTLALGIFLISASPKQANKIVAVTENAYTPLNFVDPKTGKGIGMEYDLVNAIAARAGYTVEWKICSWDVMIQGVRDGLYDVGMDGITITDDRKKQVDFSVPYLTSQQFILVRANENRFTDAKSLGANPKLLIGAQAGTTNFYVAVNNVLDGNEKNPRIKLFETFGATVQALIAGDIDALLMDAASSNGYIGANPGKLKQLPGALGTEDLGFIFKQGSPLTAVFNKALADMKKDGSLAKLETKWFYEYSKQK